jgi:bifunctional UDP-N-acetylglucosamine pyrophosphorylase/glucosamine-1-phosphate N-acetyltransferase
MGVNSRMQLAQVGKIMQQRIQARLMSEGVTIVDPPNTWIDDRARIGQDTVIEPFTCIRGPVRIGAGCRIGPFAYVQDGADLGDRTRVPVFTDIRGKQAFAKEGQ